MIDVIGTSDPFRRYKVDFWAVSSVGRASRSLSGLSQMKYFVYQTEAIKRERYLKSLKSKEAIVKLVSEGR